MPSDDTTYRWVVTFGDPIVWSAQGPVPTLRERLVSELRWRVSEALIGTVAEIDWCARKIEALGSWLDRLALRWGDDA